MDQTQTLWGGSGGAVSLQPLTLSDPRVGAPTAKQDAFECGSPPRHFLGSCTLRVVPAAARCCVGQSSYRPAQVPPDSESHLVALVISPPPPPVS